MGILEIDRLGEWWVSRRRNLGGKQIKLLDLKAKFSHEEEKIATPRPSNAYKPNSNPNSPNALQWIFYLRNLNQQ